MDKSLEWLQVHGLRGVEEAQPSPVTMRGSLQAVVKNTGLRALFAGLSINYLKVVPSTAIGFTMYDAAKHYLGLPQNL